MPTYTYTAISKEGERFSGKELTKDEHELASLLRDKGYVLVEARPLAERRKRLQFLKSVTSLFGVPLTEKLMFTRNLKLMVTSGIPLPRSLEVLEEQAKSRKLKKAIVEMRSRILKGEQLSSAMAEHPSVFSELFVNMVKVGEESGTMETVLSNLTLQLEREHELKSKIQGALMYPAVIVIAMIGIGILMLVLVVPNLAATFRELNIELPLTTRFVIGLGEFIVNFWYLAILLFGGFVIGTVAAFRTTVGKRLWDTVALNIPLVSNLTRKIQTAFTARTLSSLIGAGVPLVRSLEITSSVLGNVHFRTVLQSASQRIQKGEQLAEVLAESKGLYPVVLVQMLEVGQETGQTSNILQKLAEFYEDEVANITKNLASVIEPVLMLFIGAVVGFFAISMIQPMYSMLGGAQ